MTHTELLHTYLRYYAGKNLYAIAELLAEDVHLRDWNISVFGKAESIAIRVLENADTVAGEQHIVVNGNIDLFVVDLVTFNA